MTLFSNNTHREIWRARWCATCFEPHEAQRRIQEKDIQCPIWAKAMKSDRKPPEWDRTRSDEMEKSIKCNAYEPRPAAVKRGNKFEDVPMFDVEPREAHLVPVDGWPERPCKDKEVDHQ